MLLQLSKGRTINFFKIVSIDSTCATHPSIDEILASNMKLDNECAVLTPEKGEAKRITKRDLSVIVEFKKKLIDLITGIAEDLSRKKPKK